MIIDCHIWRWTSTDVIYAFKLICMLLSCSANRHASKHICAISLLSQCSNDLELIRGSIWIQHHSMFKQTAWINMPYIYRLVFVIIMTGEKDKPVTHHQLCELSRWTAETCFYALPGTGVYLCSQSYDLPEPYIHLFWLWQWPRDYYKCFLWY